MSDVVLLDIDQFVATITINRPDKLNALNADVLNHLQRVIDSIRTDDSVHVAVITGAGAKSFVAGADIGELHEQEVVSGRAFALQGQHVFNSIERLGKPTIAAVNGFALGGGCELAMACHLRFASENAKFGQPEINLAIIPGYGGTQRLPRLVGQPKAMELILSGAMITAAEALSLGLVNRVYLIDELLEKTIEFARQLATKAPLALYACLEAVQAAGDTFVADGQLIEANIFARVCGSDDFKEGTSAFLEKRKAQFVGH